MCAERRRQTRDRHRPRARAHPPDRCAAREAVRAWTEPALLKQWFAPLPWTTPHAELDVRPGGANLIVMRGPDGTIFPTAGVYLEVVQNERLVFTDAYTEPGSRRTSRS